MKLLKYSLIVTLLCLAKLCVSQSTDKILQPLIIGDKVPDILLTNLIHYPVSKIHISELKGKLIILDFWTTYCGSCVKEFPNLDSLQKKYKDKLVVLGVSYEKKEKIKAFLANNKIACKTSFPILTDDSILSKLFPHESVPHEVWIDSSLNVYQVTDPSYITTENIQLAMADKTFKPMTKIDLVGYENNKPLSSSYNPLIEQKVLYRSAMYSYLGGVSSYSTLIDSASNTMTLRFTDIPILELYNQITNLKDFGGGLNKRTILNVKDKGRYLQGEQQYAEWKYKNAYSYEITTKADTPDSLLCRWMVEDVNRYLNLDTKIETRKIKCFVVKTIKPYKTSYRMREEEYDNINNSIRLVNNSLKPLLIYLNKYTTLTPDYPTIEGTGFNDGIDLEIAVKKDCSFSELQKMLQAYGIAITEEEREMKVFVLTEK